MVHDLDDSLSPLSIFVYHSLWRQGMFVKHFVHKLEVRCLKLRPWSESPGRQVMHSRGFEGRTHEGLHDPHDRHQFHFNFYHFHLQSILKPMGNECFFSLCLPLSIEIAEKPRNLKIFQVTWPPGRSRRAYSARAGSDSCGSGSRWASELWNGGPWNVKPVEKVSRKIMEK